MDCEVYIWSDLRPISTHAGIIRRICLFPRKKLSLAQLYERALRHHILRASKRNIAKALALIHKAILEHIDDTLTKPRGSGGHLSRDIRIDLAVCHTSAFQLWQNTLGKSLDT